MDKNINAFNIKKWVDRLLVLDFFVVLVGAVIFISALLLSVNGSNKVLDLFQALWFPLFIPAITLLISAAIVNALLPWLKQLGRLLSRGTES